MAADDVASAVGRTLWLTMNVEKVGQKSFSGEV